MVPVKELAISGQIHVSIHWQMGLKFFTLSIGDKSSLPVERQALLSIRGSWYRESA